MQIHDYINRTCEGNLGVAVQLEANHMCACVRGVRHNSTMKTSKLSGAFIQKQEVREEFYFFIQGLKK
jgi:GTP cyclohydrolase I